MIIDAKSGTKLNETNKQRPAAKAGGVNAPNKNVKPVDDNANKQMVRTVKQRNNHSAFVRTMLPSQWHRQTTTPKCKCAVRHCSKKPPHQQRRLKRHQLSKSPARKANRHANGTYREWDKSGKKQLSNCRGKPEDVLSLDFSSPPTGTGPYNGDDGEQLYSSPSLVGTMKGELAGLDVDDESEEDDIQFEYVVLPTSICVLAQEYSSEQTGKGRMVLGVLIVGGQQKIVCRRRPSGTG
jgi:hypothetical protein